MRAFFERFARYRSSALTLVAANLVPLIGVLFWNWNAFEIVALYWLENVIIGLVYIFKMITCHPDPDKIDAEQFGFMAKDLQAIKKTGWTAYLSIVLMNLVLVPFFIVHYGGFCYGHGSFIFHLFEKDRLPETIEELWQFLVQEHLVWGVAALAGSHLWSYFINFLGKGEYRWTLPDRLMFQPYARVAVLHVAIIFGGFVVAMLGSPLPLLIALILGKTVLDLVYHFKERLRNAFGMESGSAGRAADKLTDNARSEGTSESMSELAESAD
ncbi:MAG: hypothetical protein H0W34_06180 [Pyrinomonadaceae bacterium]|nr:hypothetical protein [Pirellulales bacterium]MBA3571553.1 hypothetical protein [Pyrinomonadaceae bacterium]